MATRKRKIRRQRGSRLHGWGVSGQHRDSGMRGGRGNAGRFKHKKTNTSKYEPPGKSGFKNPTTPIQSRIINVGELDRLIKRMDNLEKKLPINLNLASLGYTKLLGKGLVKIPFNVKIEKTSKSAAKKITDAGGSITSKIR
ncbi:uL15 family ribosomal protein [[Eubacterium] cellulosolvens]